MLLLDAVNFVSKVLVYAVSLGAIGAALHGSLGLIAHRCAYIWFAGLVAIAAVVRLLVLNAQMGGSFGAAFSAEQFEWTWAGGGPPALALFAGAGLLVLCWLTMQQALLLWAAVAISASFGLTGHTAGLEAPGFAPWVVVGHLLIAGFWLAAPITLWPRAAMTETDVLARTKAFSRVAKFIVPFVFASGLYLFWRINGGFLTALSSGYGQLLVAKLLAATLILGLGALNMTIITRQLSAEPMRGRTALRSTLRIDAALFLLVIIIVATATTLIGPPEMGV